MEKKETIEKMWYENPAKGREWYQWFFDNVYEDDEAMLLVKNGSPVSSMLLQKYVFRYCGRDLSCAYIAGATTPRQLRARGYMSELMRQAVGECYARGEVFASLIPAHDSLYFYYDRFGFATVVYVDVERYTSLHEFTDSGGFSAVDVDYEILHYLETLRDASIIHTPAQWKHIMDNLSLCGGYACAVADAAGLPAALAVASEHGGEVIVRFLACPEGSTSPAADKVLSMVREHFGKKPFEVWASPGMMPTNPRLRARGMMRIIDAQAVFSALAEANPSMQQVIALHDPLITANNGYYIIRGGECRMTDSTMRPVTLNVDISTMTSILFSSPQIGSVFGISSCRPTLDLMLD